ncbi:potassium channel family protein [Nocardiopsis sp. N85]|uniref:potassium channel family protein n=1 Tax=Nocardiopsis sp. N85 TaxID=3029400 RepID=UPI00237F4998|nr:potassium channel family protein [Nocardiopsis sp. N85]MDE3724551.1 potassium channel family protein [Nocardiopsis sp. N85]
MVFVSLLGLLIVVSAVCDAAATVLHPDAEGLVAGRVRKVVWRSVAVAGARLPRVERRVLALAGPLIVASTFLVWITLLILGLALAVWPMLEEGFEIQTDMGPAGFADALYFAGGTITVLGYGDLTPLTVSGQAVSLVGAAVGFTLFTGMATYAIEVIGGVSTRNRFALSVHDDTRDRGGVTMFAEHLSDGGASDTRTQCRDWAAVLREVDELVHRYPLVAFTYRSRRDEYDPEPALRHMAEATVAALVASGHEPSLRTSAQTLDLALTRLQRTIADTYLTGEVVRRLRDPRPDDHDRRAVEEVERMLAAGLDDTGGAPVEGGREAVAETVHRCRVFLDGLHAWARSEAPPYEWDAR